MENHHFSWVNQLISMAMFNSYLCMFTRPGNPCDFWGGRLGWQGASNRFPNPKNGWRRYVMGVITNNNQQYYYWLVVSNMFQPFFIFHVIWMDVILPIDELHVFSRWLKSPTSMTWVWLWGVRPTYGHNEKIIGPWIQGRGTLGVWSVFFCSKGSTENL